MNLGECAQHWHTLDVHRALHALLGVLAGLVSLLGQQLSDEVRHAQQDEQDHENDQYDTPCRHCAVHTVHSQSVPTASTH